MITAIIIDDENKRRSTLTKLLKLVCPQVEVLGDAGSVDEAIIMIEEMRPELIFLDIEIGPQTGFDVLAYFKDDLFFSVIFVTAYQQYAVEAFRFSAVDYLMKPVDPDELATAVQKINKDSVLIKSQIDTIIRKFDPSSPIPAKLVLPTLDGLSFINLEDIIYVQADTSYSIFYIRNAKKLVVSRSLKEYDELLSAYGFVRIHQSYLINLKHLKEYIKGEGGQVVMNDETVIDVSRRKKEELIAAIQVSFLQNK